MTCMYILERFYLLFSSKLYRKSVSAREGINEKGLVKIHRIPKRSFQFIDSTITRIRPQRVALTVQAIRTFVRLYQIFHTRYCAISVKIKMVLKGVLAG